jgi:primosomal protein N' (replication factor Y) (superfamily II helicase)
VEVIGPAPLPLYRLRGHFRWHVMLRGKSMDPIRNVIRQALDNFRKKTGIYIAVDVDPIAIL